MLAPHPDDAEIGSPSALSGRAATRPIVTVTSGKRRRRQLRGRLRPDRPQQYPFKGYLRAVDSVTVPWQGGIPPERCFNLGYFDARLKTMREKPTRWSRAVRPEQRRRRLPARATSARCCPRRRARTRWTHLVEDLVAISRRRWSPRIVVAPHPYLDNHADHQYVTVALARGAGALEEAGALPALHEPRRDATSTPTVPAGTNVSLPPWRVAARMGRRHELPVQRRVLPARERGRAAPEALRARDRCTTCGWRRPSRRPAATPTPAASGLARVSARWTTSAAARGRDEVFFVYDRDGPAQPHPRVRRAHRPAANQ